MTTRTAAFFEALARAPLLAHVGEPLPDGVHASLVESWKAALARPRQYDRLASLYLLGGFPCGWRGDYPQGSLEVF